MFRWISLLFSLVFLVLGLLTFFRAPNLLAWKMAILAGEFGHWAGLLTFVFFALSLASWMRDQNRESVRLLAGLSWLAATGLLFSPLIRARGIAHRLPGELESALGAAHVGNAPLSASRLWGALSFGRPSENKHIFSSSGGENLSLDFYAAKNRTDSAPCIILVHGGGWDNGSRQELPGLDEALAERGYAVAAIDYRLAPKWKWSAQRDDVVTAVRYIKSHAPEFNIDPERLVLMGRSAGGQIAVATAYSTGDLAIRGVISLYGPHDLLFAWKYGSEDDVLNSLLLLKQLLGGTPESARANFESASGYLHVRNGLPPTLMIHGAIDTLVWNKQSERLNAKLAEFGVPHYFLSIPWGVHAFDFNINGPSSQLSLYAIEHFLQVVTK